MFTPKKSKSTNSPVLKTSPTIRRLKEMKPLLEPIDGEVIEKDITTQQSSSSRPKSSQ
jgi:hypothetical protein